MKWREKYVFDRFRHGNCLLERSREEKRTAGEGGVGGDGVPAGVEDSREEGSEESLKGGRILGWRETVRYEEDDEEK